MAQLTPNDRDRGRERAGTATATIAILAAGVAGAGAILAWHSTAEAAAQASDPVTSTGQQGGGQVTRQQQNGDDQGQGGSWSGVPGGSVDLPPGGISGAQPPGQGSGGGSVRSHGS